MINLWQLPVVKLCVGCTLATLAVVTVWGGFAPFKIDVSSFAPPLAGLPAFVAFMIVSGGLMFWFADDASRPAVSIKFLAARLYNFSAVMIFMLCYAPAAVLLSYLTMSAGLPMQDPLYASVDAALGFNWDALLVFVNSHPTLAWVLTKVYVNGATQMAAVFLLLMAANRTVDTWDFIALLMLGSLGSIIVSGLLPAVAPYTYYGPDPSHFDALERIFPGVGRVHVSDVLQLHSGLYPSFAFGKNQGLVTFPSYHTFEAIVLVYGVRHFKWVMWPMVVLSSLVVVSTLPIGGHYLVDLIGGAALALASIALIDFLNGRPSMWSRAWPRVRAIAGWDAAPGPQAAGAA
jgi:membrane-associated phospholipid phosphatase